MAFNATTPPTSVSPLQAREQATRLARKSALVSLILWGPVIIYFASIWTVKPFSLGDTLSLSLATPAVLLVSLFAIRVPRRHMLECFRMVRFEFSILCVIVLLSLLSLINSNDPIRSFRIIFPSLLPFALFCHLAVLRFAARENVLKVPRLLVYSAFGLSILPFLLSFGIPPLKSYLFGEYRLHSFFENSIQHAIALGVTVPLLVVEYATAKSLAKKALWSFAILLMLYTMFRSGSKTATVVSFGVGTLFYGLLTIRSGNLLRIVMLVVGMTVFGILMWTHGLTIAEYLNPIVAEKIRSIIEGGVANYHSIESRKLLWQEAIHQGRQHWLIGSGAGEKVLGVSHAHNLVLDYFKGIGIFGAAAIVLLCLSILSRTAAKLLFVIRGYGNETDFRILACYLGASIYVVCNQMSDCFGPTTIAFLWIVYLSARLSERQAGDRSAATPRPNGQIHAAPLPSQSGYLTPIAGRRKRR